MGQLTPKFKYRLMSTKKQGSSAINKRVDMNKTSSGYFQDLVEQVAMLEGGLSTPA
jgi:hypothetical protein